MMREVRWKGGNSRRKERGLDGGRNKIRFDSLVLDSRSRWIDLREWIVNKKIDRLRHRFLDSQSIRSIHSKDR